MHLIDNKGVPSKGHIINITANSVAAVAARPDTVSASGDPIDINALENDSGVGLTLSVPSLWSQQGGNIAVVNDNIRYKAKSGFNGTDKIYYTAKDSQNATSWSAVTINVSGNNLDGPLPVGRQDTVSAVVNVAVTFDVLANDTGAGLVLTAPNAWSWRGGTVRLLNNALSYTPKTNFIGLDKIWYTFKDAQGRQAWSVVNINVMP